ncbi:putative cytochrome P450 126 [Actinomadura rubrobrunea]|uniref:Cytochrome P450 126 n=1 Tax=Actinomadura rubrobrunea TaxID=115335 RepID=A0A9W6UX31_9ACTN|nr:cytochrome P450 [Actinomadura rubrobrunea]GLW64280.1 putative cytochrome P450 126 [Actinomadura rubrobrunea]
MDAVDLADLALYETGDPAQTWQRLRAQCPVYRNERDEEPFWAVLDHRLAGEVLRDGEVFTSERGMRLDHDPAAAAAAAGKMLIVTDGPRHAKIRRLIGSAFTPRMVRRLEETMRRTVAERLEQALEQEVCEFAEVAAHLPVAVICDMLGVPRADWGFLLDRTMTAFGSTEDPARAAQAHTDILLYCSDLVERRRKEPGEDVVSAMVTGTVDGVPLTDEEIILNCDGLISGANETTRHASIGGLRALIDSPEQWRRLRDRPDLLPTAVQEVLRYTSPALHVLRTATRDTELGGHRISAGERVAVWLPAANRDERAFERAAAFDVTRAPNRHLAFGHGPHRCLGATLATAELTVLFDELLRKVEHAELAGEPRRLRSNLIWGYRSMPVAWTPR